MNRPPQSPESVALYLVASPLQYLAAKQIAKRFEPTARRVLVYYKRGVAPVIRPDDWDAVWFMPWPRFDPLPGPFGGHRRLLDNLRRVAELCGRCETLLIHSAVFDSEVTNYFLRGLPRLTGATEMHARILPDGLISIRRYPLSRLKCALQYLRKFRRLFSRELDYWCFSGDRLGSDAAFVDRIYTLAGLPHQYPREKVVELPPLVEPAAADDRPATTRRALLIGQPLVGAGLLADRDLPAVTDEMHRWLHEQGAEQIDYKGHPKDPRRELYGDGDHILQLDEPIETYMTHTHYDLVVGVRSTVLLFARQIYGRETRVVAFAWDRVRFKSEAERQDMADAFAACGVEFQ